MLHEFWGVWINFLKPFWARFLHYASTLFAWCKIACCRTKAQSHSRWEAEWHENRPSEYQALKSSEIKTNSWAASGYIYLQFSETALENYYYYFFKNLLVKSNTCNASNSNLMSGVSYLRQIGKRPFPRQKGIISIRIPQIAICLANCEPKFFLQNRFSK